MTGPVCARCATPMRSIQLGEALAYACNTCGAVFLGHAHAARVRAGFDRTAPMLAERGAENRRPVEQARDTALLACPCCGVAMEPEWVMEKRLRIDHCRSHGTFFDAHELAALAPAVVAPRGVWRPGGGGHVGNPSFGDAALEILGQILLG